MKAILSNTKMVRVLTHTSCFTSPNVNCPSHLACPIFHHLLEYTGAHKGREGVAAAVGVRRDVRYLLLKRKRLVPPGLEEWFLSFDVFTVTLIYYSNSS